MAAEVVAARLYMCLIFKLVFNTRGVPILIYIWYLECPFNTPTLK